MQKDVMLTALKNIKENFAVYNNCIFDEIFKNGEFNAFEWNIKKTDDFKKLEEKINNPDALKAFQISDKSLSNPYFLFESIAILEIYKLINKKKLKAVNISDEVCSFASYFQSEFLNAFEKNSSKEEKDKLMKEFDTVKTNINKLVKEKIEEIKKEEKAKQLEQNEEEKLQDEYNFKEEEIADELEQEEEEKLQDEYNFKEEEIADELEQEEEEKLQDEYNFKEEEIADELEQEEGEKLQDVNEVKSLSSNVLGAIFSGIGLVGSMAAVATIVLGVGALAALPLVGLILAGVAAVTVGFVSWEGLMYNSVKILRKRKLQKEIKEKKDKGKEMESQEISIEVDKNENEVNPNQETAQQQTTGNPSIFPSNTGNGEPVPAQEFVDDPNKGNIND